MGLSVVSQTRCKIDVFPAFALPIPSTRNLIAGNLGRLLAAGAVWLCAVREVLWLSAVRAVWLCVVRLCAVPIGAVRCEDGEDGKSLIDRFRCAQTTCSPER